MSIVYPIRKVLNKKTKRYRKRSNATYMFYSQFVSKILVLLIKNAFVYMKFKRTILKIKKWWKSTLNDKQSYKVWKLSGKTLHIICICILIVNDNYPLTLARIIKSKWQKHSQIKTMKQTVWLTTNDINTIPSNAELFCQTV